MTSMSKFGVELHTSGRHEMQQPKPKNKFRVLLYGFGGGGQWNDDTSAIAVETNAVTRPKISFNAKEMHMFDGVASYSGKKRWEEITLEVKDTVHNKPLKAIANQLQQQSDFHRRMAPRDPNAGYKFEMWIQTMSGEADVSDYLDTAAAMVDKFLLESDSAPADPTVFKSTLDTWVCQGCMVTNYDFGQLDFNDSNFYTMTLTIKPDHCFVLDETGKPLSKAIGSSFVDGMIDSAIDYGKDVASDALAKVGGLF